MSNTNPIKPRRGEVWDVNFSPTVESEVQRIYPAVVINSDSIGCLPVRLIIPISDWNNQFSGNIWHVPIKPNHTNGLTEVAAVDPLQIRRVAVKCFISRRGRLDATLVEEIVAAIAAIIEYK